MKHSSLSNEKVLKVILKAFLSPPKMSNPFLDVAPPQNVSLDNRQKRRGTYTFFFLFYSRRNPDCANMQIGDASILAYNNDSHQRVHTWENKTKQTQKNPTTLGLLECVKRRESLSWRYGSCCFSWCSWFPVADLCVSETLLGMVCKKNPTKNICWKHGNILSMKEIRAD